MKESLLCFLLLLSTPFCLADELADRNTILLQKDLDALIINVKKVLPKDQVVAFDWMQNTWKNMYGAYCSWLNELQTDENLAILHYNSCMQSQIKQKINDFSSLLCENFGANGDCNQDKSL